MSTHINMGTGSIWVCCHKKLLKTKFCHLILILKTQPFTKSKIEYLSFGCEGHWQYSQISYRSIEYHCNLPKLSLTYIFVTQVACGFCWGPRSRRVFYVCKSFLHLFKSFTQRGGKGESLGFAHWLGPKLPNPVLSGLEHHFWRVGLVWLGLQLGEHAVVLVEREQAHLRWSNCKFVIYGNNNCKRRPQVTFKSWILTSEKKNQAAWIGVRGGFRWFRQCPKENVFFLWCLH